MAQTNSAAAHVISVVSQVLPGANYALPGLRSCSSQYKQAQFQQLFLSYSDMREGLFTPGKHQRRHLLKTITPQKPTFPAR